MYTTLRISFLLLLTISLFHHNGLAQSGTPIEPPPPTPHGGELIGDYSLVPVTLDGTLTLNNIGAWADSKVGLVRNVAQSLLQPDRISLVYRMEGPASALDTLSNGDTIVGQVIYRKLALDSVRENFFDDVTDFLVTDGKKYFRIKFGT